MSREVRGQLRGNHRTLTDLALQVVDLAKTLPGVRGVSPGYIQAGKGGGKRKVKIADGKGCLLLTVRQSHTIQEVRIFSLDLRATKLALARALRDQDIPISFNH